MKLLVVSDSHGVLTGMEQAVLREQPDLIYHLGDCVRDADWLRERFSIYIERFNVPLDNCKPHALDRGYHGVVVLAVGGAVEGRFSAGDVLYFLGG